ncbi:hypothetical protein [Nostoc favosum]|uniref:Thioesterase n=1 Tax=Nostoc favosum CHAB5714 TaxID=2780399 RepID=A0ABS8IHF0_9NOSO|nr:hypothetical protein [Nostoc favosum]MCC5603256.1 hypothetical protein [Nostoc favosum CHAB5714]
MMNTLMMDAFKNEQLTVVKKQPHFEGSNICTWIGFKHVMYLAEEAVIQHLRNCKLVPRQLYEEHGLCFEITESSANILHALHMDDLVRIEVQPKIKPKDGELTFSIQMFVQRDSKEVKAYTGKVKTLFRQDRSGVTVSVLPDELAPYVVAEINRSASKPVSEYAATSDRSTSNAKDDLIRQVVPEDANSFVWKWHVPYFYCHFTERLQHSGYLRLMEEVVDLFLADRGISIRTMLDTRRWIPVVPKAQIEILREALMEETIYTVYTVEDIFKDFTYTSRIDCYVIRDGVLIHTATGKITHGYAKILNRQDWELVNFDEETLVALRGKGGIR